MYSFILLLKKYERTFFLWFQIARAKMGRIWSGKRKCFHQDSMIYRPVVLLSMNIKVVQPVTTHLVLVELTVADGIFTLGPVMSLAMVLFFSGCCLGTSCGYDLMCIWSVSFHHQSVIIIIILFHRKLKTWVMWGFGVGRREIIFWPNLLRLSLKRLLLVSSSPFGQVLCFVLARLKSVFN